MIHEDWMLELNQHNISFRGYNVILNAIFFHFIQPVSQSKEIWLFYAPLNPLIVCKQQ